MKIVFLGTSGWYDTKTGNTTCILIETKKEYIILDAGNGFYKIDRYIRAKKPIYLFLSHFHLDHIVGLHILNKFNFSQGIHIFGQLGTKNILKTIVNEPYTISLTTLPYDVEGYELSEGQHNIPFSVKCKFLLHSSQCLGYRIEIDGKVITYCPDTGICDNLFLLAKDADLLIAECSYKSGQEDENWPHLNPESAARVARDSGAKKLALIHFDASLYSTMKDREDAEIQAKKIFRNSFAAMDNMQIKV